MDSVAYKPLGVANNHMNHGQIRRFESRHLKLLFTLIALFITIIVTLQIISQQRPVIVNFNSDDGIFRDQASSLYSRGPNIQNHHIYHHNHIDGHQHEPQDDDLLYDKATQDEPVWWVTDIRYKHVVLGNYVRATKSFKFNSTITLTTQATLEFMYHTIELCRRWDGPLSVAVYAPGDELAASLTMIEYLRNCHTMAECIKQKVTWHLVYDLTHGPKLSQVNYPGYYVRADIMSAEHQQTYCRPTHPHRTLASINDEGEDDVSNVTRMAALLSNNYRKLNKLPYPINVLRNTARVLAKTKYVLASDIELYPSIHMVSSFMNLIQKSIESPSSFPEITNHEKHVFTLPIFEVQGDVKAPKTKLELHNLMLQGKAIFFHKFVCDQCQEFPRRLEWIDVDIRDTSRYQQELQLSIFDVTKRNSSQPYWEPIFIGKNDEPLYDDRLTWEGRRDKMGQVSYRCEAF